MTGIMNDWRMILDPATAPGALAAAVVVFGCAALLSWLLGRLISRWQEPFRRLFRQTDETLWRYVIHLKSLLVFVLALAVFASIIPGLRAFLGTLVAGAGITAILIGLAAKSSLANLVSGVALAIYRPIRIGDTVTIEEEYGTIEDITLRHTILLTWENKRMVIPNEKLDNMTVINYTLTDPKILCRVEIGVSYDTDIDLARRLILDEAGRCPHRIPDDRAPRPPWVRVVGLEDFSIQLRAYLWAPSMDEAWLARFWLLEMVKKRFDREGVEIPFPYRTLVYKKDLPPARREEDQSSQTGESGPIKT